MDNTYLFCAESITLYLTNRTFFSCCLVDCCKNGYKVKHNFFLLLQRMAITTSLPSPYVVKMKLKKAIMPNSDNTWKTAACDFKLMSFIWRELGASCYLWMLSVFQEISIMLSKCVGLLFQYPGYVAQGRFSYFPSDFTSDTFWQQPQNIFL